MNLRKSHYIILVSTGFLLFLTGLFLLSHGIRQPIMQMNSANWISVPAHFETLEIAQSDDTYRVVTKYRYEYHSKCYTGDRFNFDVIGPSNISRMKDAIRRVKADSKVWINPSKPEESVAIRAAVGVPYHSVASGCVLATFGVGLAFGFPANRTLRKRAETIWDSGHYVRPGRARLFLYHFLALAISNATSIFALAIGASIIPPSADLPVFLAINGVGQIGAIIYSIRRRRILSALIHCTSTPGNNAPVSFDVELHRPAFELCEGLKMKLQIYHTVGITRQYLFAEYSFRPGGDRSDRCTYTMSPDDDSQEEEHIGILRSILYKLKLLQRPDDKPSSDTPLGRAVATILAGKIAENVTAMERVRKFFSNTGDIDTAVVITWKGKKMSIYLPKSFWEGVVRDEEMRKVIVTLPGDKDDHQFGR